MLEYGYYDYYRKVSYGNTTNDCCYYRGSNGYQICFINSSFLVVVIDIVFGDMHLAQMTKLFCSQVSNFCILQRFISHYNLFHVTYFTSTIIIIAGYQIFVYTPTIRLTLQFVSRYIFYFHDHYK